MNSSLAQNATALVVLVAAIALIVFLVKYSFNETIPKIFPGANFIGWKQAILLLVLTALLFGSGSSTGNHATKATEMLYQ